ncbi:methyl-accepting chemotaxis protein [Succinimonas sp.]|uniref:methyl-accepting chemotaxis protein n=1 Tax=Succinimonas sp. TaxID=1936151 RepID=UPI0038633B1A
MNPSLKRRLVVISATAITVIISIVVFLSYSKARAILTENMTTGILPGKIQAATADLEKELETYRTIAIGMNGDLGEIDAVTNPKGNKDDDAAIVKYLTHIKNTQNTTAAFFVSALSEKYYVYDKFLKTLSPKLEKDRWFYDVIKSGKPYLYNLDLDENTSQLSVFLNYIIKDSKGKILGVAGVGNSLSNLSSRFNEYNKTHPSKVYLINEKGQITLGGTKEQTGKSYSPDAAVNKAILDSAGFAVHHIERDGTSYIVGSSFVPAIGWHMIMEVPESVALAQANTLAWEQIIIGFISIPLFSLILALIISKLLTPLRRISRELLTLGGDLTFRLEYSKQDEIGDIVKGVNTFLERLQHLVAQNKIISEEMNSLTVATDEASENAKRGLKIQQDVTKTFVETVSELTIVAESIAKNAEDAAASTGKANEITDSSKVQVSEMMKSMNSVASRVDTAVKKVNALNNASQQIEMILSVISSISEQTTLLALNAAIEAARAGEVGRGFAVVADEIRSLATKTQNSTEEISRVLKDLQKSTQELDSFMLDSQQEAQDTMGMAEQTEQMLQKMIEVTGNINSMIIQISSAAEEHSCVARKLQDDSASISEITDQVHEMLMKQNDMFAEQQECSRKQKQELDKFTV